MVLDRHPVMWPNPPVDYWTRVKPALAVMLAATGFSWGFIIVKAVGLPAISVAFFRTWIGAIALLLVLWLRHRPRPKHWASMVGAGLCFGLHQLLFIAAAQATSIAIVTLVQCMQPLLIVLVSRRVLAEPVPRGLVFSSVLALLGVGLVVAANRTHGSHSLAGDLFALGNLLAFLGYFLFSKRGRSEGLDTLELTGWSMTIAALFITPFFLWSPWVPRQEGLLPSGPQLALLAFHALVPGNGHLLVNWAHGKLPAALSSLLLSLMPVLASLWAHLVFKEPYGAWHLLGTALTVTAIELGRRAVERQAT